jgi:hypothetical protein
MVEWPPTIFGYAGRDPSLATVQQMKQSGAALWACQEGVQSLVGHRVAGRPVRTPLVTFDGDYRCAGHLDQPLDLLA